MQSSGGSNDQSLGIANSDSGGNPHAATANRDSGSIRDGNGNRRPDSRFQSGRIAH